MAGTYDYSSLFDENGRMRDDAETIWRTVQARIENAERELRKYEMQFALGGSYVWQRNGAGGEWDAMPSGPVIVDRDKKNLILCKECPCDNTACYWLFESSCTVETDEHGSQTVKWSEPALISVECSSKPDILNQWFWYQDDTMRIYKGFDASKNPDYKGESDGCDPENNVCSQMVPPKVQPPTGVCCRSVGIGEFLIKQEERGWEVEPSETTHKHETRVDTDPDGELRIKYGIKTLKPKDIKVQCPLSANDTSYFDCGRIYGSVTAPDCEWVTWKLEFPVMQARLTLVLKAPDGDLATWDLCFIGDLEVSQEPRIDDVNHTVTNIQYSPKEVKIAPGWTAYLLVSALWSFPKKQTYAGCLYDPNIRCTGADTFLGPLLNEEIVGHKWLPASINDISIPQIAKSQVCIEYNYYSWTSYCEKDPCNPECSRVSDPEDGGVFSSQQYPPFPYNGPDSLWQSSSASQDMSRVSGWLHQDENNPQGVWRRVDGSRDKDATWVRLMCKDDFFTADKYNADNGNAGEDYAYKPEDHDLPAENGTCEYIREPDGPCGDVIGASDVICPDHPQLACCKQGSSFKVLDKWKNGLTLPKHCFDAFFDGSDYKEGMACPGMQWRIFDVGDGDRSSAEEGDYHPDWGSGHCYGGSGYPYGCGIGYEYGYVNDKGQLVGLPRCFEHANCYFGYMELQAKCPDEAWSQC